MKPVRLVAGLTAMIAAAVAIASDSTAQFQVRLSADKQALHALNRLGYGPRPGDVEAVRRQGVKDWIRAQLNPESVPENAALTAKLEALMTLRLPTWQVIETFQPPPLQFSSMLPSALAQLPVNQRTVVSSNSSTPEERRAVLMALTPEVRSQVLGALLPQMIDPEFRQEAERGRQMQQEMISRQLSDQQRRLTPPLSELLTPDQLQILRHGSDAEKTALIEPLDALKRQQLFRSMGPQGAKLLPPSYQRAAGLASNPQQGVVNDVIEAKLQRALYSNRQLEEVLVDFWFNHFNVSVTKPQVRMLLPSYERDAIRPHVLGNFRDMLLATARHPAMLFYLDNFQSQAPRPEMLQMAAASGGNIRLPGINENYGRELLELHTLGVNGGYTQEDVVNVARAFTGWTIFDVARVGEFQFNPQFHDRAEKTVLGVSFPRGGGEREGVQVIELLAKHPSTARFISHKLAQRFVADQPPAALVERVAGTFTKTGGDLRAVMETLLLSQEFMSAGSWRSKVKSPLEMVVSSLRALDADVTDTAAVAQRIAELGQPLYAKAEPTGYPNSGEAWSNSVGLLGRMNFASALVAGQIAGVKADPSSVVRGDVQRSMVVLTGVAASAETVAAIRGNARGATPEPALLATALIGSPDFQKR